EMGNALMQQDRIEEAIVRYRDALSISRESGGYRLALGLALVKAQHYDEAEIYLSQILKADPDDGRANLAMARIAAAKNRTRDAINYYRRAIHDTWPPGSENERVRARFELVDFLIKTG